MYLKSIALASGLGMSDVDSPSLRIYGLPTPVLLSLGHAQELSTVHSQSSAKGVHTFGVGVSLQG